MKTDTTVDPDALSVADYSETGSEIDRFTEPATTPKVNKFWGGFCKILICKGLI